jgi:moderate conductance mechanosensitive channel
MATRDRKHLVASTRALWSSVLAIALSVALISGAAAAPRDGSSEAGTTPPELHQLLVLLADPKGHQLLTLLADPKIQAWLEAQGEAKTTAGPVQRADPPADEGFGKRWGSMLSGEQAGDGGSLIRGLPAPVFHESGLSSDAGAIHDQIMALARAIPNLPNEFARAAARVTAVQGEHEGTDALLNLAAFVAFGLFAQWLFRRLTRGVRERLERLPMETVQDRLRLVAVRSALALGVIAAFTLGCLGPLFVLAWDPARRQTVLSLLLAFGATWVAIATGDLLLAPNDERFRIVPMDRAAARFWCRRLAAVVGWFAFVWVIIEECSTLGFTYEGLQLVGYTLGLGTVGIALEAIWRSPLARRDAVGASSADRRSLGRGAANIARSIGIVLLWAMWVAEPGIWSVMPAFWLVFVLIALPPAISASRSAVDNLLRPPGSPQTAGLPSVIEATLEHGIRALLIIAAAAVVGWGWNIDLVHLAGQDTLFARIVHGVLTTVVILLIADVLWNAARAAIDRKLVETVDLGEPNSDEARRRARLRTLLPIFRNILFFLVISIAAMMALAELGVEIGPLIAGASVVGVAIGFGAQTFVRDVIAGMFYLLDDAFRVGEYIQAGRYKGTVEGFSIRSVKLRHHRGPVFTVPFSLLGAVENMSRDWVIDKIAIGITYDSDLVLAKKLIKQIGQELAKIPEFAPLIIEPLKMQGVDALGDFAVQIRAKMMTQPGEQFVIRRQAYAMIKKAFDENGIKFAFPTVQVAGEGEAATAAVAQRGLELTRPAAA